MKERDFTTYEYKTVSVKARDRARAADMYEAFGWEITGTTAGVDCVNLSLKRDRKLVHKQELTRLERQAEETFDEINGLKRSYSTVAKAFAYIFGIISALIFGGGMCLVMLKTNSVPDFIGGIALGIVGGILCGINYPIYKKIASNRTKAILPSIDMNEEKFANILEKGNDLLNNDVI